MAKAGRRPLAVFNIKKLRKVGAFILKVMAIIQNIKNNPALFAAPKPTVLVLETDFDSLGAAEKAVLTRAPGTAQARDEAYDKLLDDVHTLLNYVQDLADASADEQAAITIIVTSGFDLKIIGTRTKPDLEAKNGSVSGTVKLIAKAAGKRASYNWQKSADGGLTWLSLTDTLKASTVVTGLTPGSQLLFRVRAITVDGPANWHQSEALIVL